MKCPYIINTVTTFVPSDEDDGYPAEITNAVVCYPVDCLLKECAAYQNNRCIRTS